RAIGVSTGNELLTQGEMVINFAIEDDRQGTAFVRDRLMSGGEVDDAQPSHADGYRAVAMEAVIVRPTMGHNPAHFAYERWIGSAITREFENSGNPAHSGFLR